MLDFVHPEVATANAKAATVNNLSMFFLLLAARVGIVVGGGQSIG
jgi:hypothetical protein